MNVVKIVGKIIATVTLIIPIVKGIVGIWKKTP